MPASPEFVALFVSGLQWDAAQLNRSLEDVLAIAAGGELVDTPRGKVLQGKDAAGAPVAFTLPPRGQLRGRDLAKLANGLLERARALRAADGSMTDGVLGIALAPMAPRPRGRRWPAVAGSNAPAMPKAA